MSIEALSTITPKETAHWYDRNGTARYDADLRTARRERLFPSVTSILKLWPKPALARYIREQDLLACLTLPRLPAETDDAFCARVIEDSGKHAGQAADFGTQIHDVFEQVLQEAQGIQCAEAIVPWVGPILAWVEKHVESVHWTEKPLVHVGYGYGCRADALLTLRDQGLTLIDAKTQGFKKDKPIFYDEWPMQLVANRQAASGLMSCASIVIDSKSPSEPIMKVWSAEELEAGWIDFLTCFELWKRTRKYNPLSA